jgi:signal transduction histidine kinase
MATLTEAVAGGTVVDARPIRSESLRPRSRVRVQDTEALPLSPATTAPPPYHDDLFDNPLRYEILTSAYTPGNIAAILAVLGGLQLVAHALEYGLHGAATRAGWPGAAVLTALLVAQTAVMPLTGRALFARRRREFYWLNGLQNMVQLLWFQTLCAVSHPAFLVVGILALVAWAFNDVRLFHDHPSLRWQFTLPFVVFDLAVLGLARGVAPGGAAAQVLAFHTSPVFYFVQMGVVGVVLAIVVLVGKHAREYDTRLWEMNHLARQNALLLKEREIIERACRLMSTGLHMSKFSHDVASPLQVLSLNVSFLRDQAERELHRADPSRAAFWQRNRDLLVRADQARRHLQQLAEGMVRAVKEQSPLRRVTVDDLVARAWTDAEAALQTHSVTPVPCETALEAASLILTDGHISTLSNILTNGVLQAPAAALRIEGARANKWFYRLSVRDFGVSPGRRAEALARIEAAMALTAPPVERDSLPSDEDTSRTYRGHGLALMMAKVLLVRHNGWIAARAPDDDDAPGVVFDIILPCVVPSEIPSEENHPERL